MRRSPPHGDGGARERHGNKPDAGMQETIPPASGTRGREGGRQHGERRDSRRQRGIEATGRYDITPDGFPLDSLDEFRQKYSSSLSEFDDSTQGEAYRFYLTEMTKIYYKNKYMNFIEFLNERMLENSGNITPTDVVAREFKLMLSEQSGPRTNR